LLVFRLDVILLSGLVAVRVTLIGGTVSVIANGLTRELDRTREMEGERGDMDRCKHMDSTVAAASR
jgi:hypothetical protein